MLSVHASAQLGALLGWGYHHKAKAWTGLPPQDQPAGGSRTCRLSISRMGEVAGGAC